MPAFEDTVDQILAGFRQDAVDRLRTGHVDDRMLALFEAAQRRMVTKPAGSDRWVIDVDSLAEVAILAGMASETADSVGIRLLTPTGAGTVAVARHKARGAVLAAVETETASRMLAAAQRLAAASERFAKAHTPRRSRLRTALRIVREAATPLVFIALGIAAAVVLDLATAVESACR